MEPTVTLPLNDYKKMEARLKKLENLNINNFITRETIDIKECKYKVVINTDKICDYIQKIYGSIPIESNNV